MSAVDFYSSSSYSSSIGEFVRKKTSIPINKQPDSTGAKLSFCQTSCFCHYLILIFTRGNNQQNN